MKKIPALIVDDELCSRELLYNYLEDHCPDIEVVAKAGSIAEAVSAITNIPLALVFLDINLHEENGFELFNKIPQPDFLTVFVSGYDQHALRAFKHHAAGYILKPVDVEELKETVNQVKKMLVDKTGIDHLQLLIQYIKASPATGKIALPVSDGLVYVPVNDIVRCEAEGNYTHMYFTNRNKILVCRTLGTYESLLKNHLFVRVHHQHLVNLRHVERYQRGRGGIVYMSDKKGIDVSQRKKEHFLKLLETLYPGSSI